MSEMVTLWLVVLIVSIGVEVATLGLTSIWFAGVAVVSVIVAAFHGPVCIGQVTVGGQEWSARTEADGMNLQPGTVVDIVAVNGVKLIVKVDPQMAKVTENLSEPQA